MSAPIVIPKTKTAARRMSKQIDILAAATEVLTMHGKIEAAKETGNLANRLAAHLRQYYSNGGI